NRRSPATACSRPIEFLRASSTTLHCVGAKRAAAAGGESRAALSSVIALGTGGGTPGGRLAGGIRRRARWGVKPALGASRPGGPGGAPPRPRNRRPAPDNRCAYFAIR